MRGARSTHHLVVVKGVGQGVLHERLGVDLLGHLNKRDGDAGGQAVAAEAVVAILLVGKHVKAAIQSAGGKFMRLKDPWCGMVAEELTHLAVLQVARLQEVRGREERVVAVEGGKEALRQQIPDNMRFPKGACEQVGR
jgi:hypothetical protein